MKQRLKNKVAIITGGGTGIGREIARTFAEHGTKVAICSRDKSILNRTAAEISPNVIPLVCNVAKINSIQRLVKNVVKKWGKIDILVNAAGSQGPLGPFDAVDQLEWWHNIEINLGGTFFFSRAVIPYMKNGGVIINFSGGGGTGLRRNFSAYATAKTAIVRLTENMGAELLPYKIRVNAIAPGPINTQLQDQIIDVGEAVVGPEAIQEARDIKSGHGVPIELVAELALWLSGPQSEPLTGKLISTVHDPWQTMTRQEIEQANKTERFTLRRIKIL